ncbi:MAG: dihydrodipicolinate reductase C-terminal domain-containing protein [Thermodesulfobacteriota bacterium]
MEPIPVMINGIPGNMATRIAVFLLRDPRFKLIPLSFTGPEISESHLTVEKRKITLIHPEARMKHLREIKEHVRISVDYTHPTAVNSNAEFYCNNGLNFVMGTTGGDRDLLEKTVRTSSVSAVISPNMAKPIVGFQAMMAFAADTFPDLFKGYSLVIRESHQKGKADTSGTAKAMISYFNRLGIPFDETRVKKERNPDIQQRVWGIPETFLSGHGWHTYSLLSEDQTVKIEFTHNVNGRDVYAFGTLDAVSYLNKKITEGMQGCVYSMIDVLTGK